MAINVTLTGFFRKDVEAYPEPFYDFSMFTGMGGIGKLILVKFMVKLVFIGDPTCSMYGILPTCVLKITQL